MPRMERGVCIYQNIKFQLMGSRGGVWDCIVPSVRANMGEPGDGIGTGNAFPGVAIGRLDANHTDLWAV